MFGFLMRRNLTYIYAYARLTSERSLHTKQKFAMDDYLIDRETLGKFVDELINNSSANTEELNSKREEIIESLDGKIGLAIFGKFTPEQNTEFNQLLERDDATEADYQNFFDKAGLDVEQIATDTMQNFAQELLGGQNV